MNFERDYNVVIYDYKVKRYRLVYETDSPAHAYRKHRSYRRTRSPSEAIILDDLGRRGSISWEREGKRTLYYYVVTLDLFDPDVKIEYPDVYVDPDRPPKRGRYSKPGRSLAPPDAPDAAADGQSVHGASPQPHEPSDCNRDACERTAPSGQPDAGDDITDAHAATTVIDKRNDVRQSPAYAADETSIYRIVREKGNVAHEPLTNFRAIIRGQIERDFGDHVRQSYEVEATVQNETCKFEIDATQFDGLGWVASQLPSSAIVYPGARRHVAAAIRACSGPVERRRVLTQTGWVRRDEQWVYADADGAIGADGRADGMSTLLHPALSDYRLPPEASDGDVYEGVHSSLALMGLADRDKLAPMLAGVYRSVLGSCGFSIYVVGRSNVYKTEVLSLAMRHLGVGLKPDRLTASWSSTAAGVASICAAAKDSIVAVDDLVSTNAAADAARADRILRDAANHVSRHRATSTGAAGPATQMQAMIMATGEELPPGQSLHTRLLAIELRPGDISPDALTRCQSDAESGRYASAMGAYVRWLAGRLENARETASRKAREYRDHVLPDTRYPRTATAIGELAAGMDTFLEFGEDYGVISTSERQDYFDRAWRALLAAANAQSDDHREQDPAERFVGLIAQAVATGAAHMAAMDEHDVLHPPQRWGWRQTDGWLWKPQGQLIGYVDDQSVYLLPDAAYRVAHRIGSTGAKAQTLWKRLDEAGMLATTEIDSHGTRLVRRTVRSQRLYLVHLRQDALAVAGDAGKSTHGDQRTDYRNSQVLASDRLRSALRKQLGHAIAEKEEGAPR